MKISLEQFKGMTPMADTRILGDTSCLFANNCNVESGKMIPYFHDVNSSTTSWESGSTNGNTAVSPISEMLNPITYSVTTNSLHWVSGSTGGSVYTNAPTGTPTIEVTERFSLTSGTASTVVNAYAEYVYTDVGTVTLQNDGDVNESEADCKAVFPPTVYNLGTGTVTNCKKYYMAKRAGSIVFNYMTNNAGTATSRNTTIQYSEGVSTGYVDVPGADNTGTPYARVSLTSVKLGRIKTDKARPDNDYIFYEGITHHFHLRCRFAYQKETRYYMYTYTYYRPGQVGKEAFESPNSPVSAMVQCRRGDIVKVTIPSLPPPGNGMERYRINLYRTAGANSKNSASFYLVAEIDSSTGGTVFYDNVLDSELGEKHMDIQNPPTGCMAGTLYAVNGSLVVAASNGFGGGTKGVWLSEPYMPYNFPVANNYTVNDNIVSLSVVGSSVIILTSKNTYVLAGSSAAAMVLKKSVYESPCVAANSVVASDGVVYYVSDEGLMCVTDDGTTKNLTEKIFNREQWDNLNPSTMASMVHASILAIQCKDKQDREFYIIWDMLNKNLTLQDLTETSPLKLKWRSKIFSFDTPVAPSVARVVASYQGASYGITFKLYSVSRADGQVPVTYPHSLFELPAHYKLEATSTVTSERAFRLPRMRKELAYFIELESPSKIVRVDLATSMGELSYVNNDRKE